MKRGNIEIDCKKIVKTNLEFEWDDSEKKTISFSSLAKQIINLYSRLTPVEDKIYIFIDELELAFKQTKKYQRDVTLIRDLIFAIEYLSDINRTHNFNVFLVTAIRSEVYKNIISKGLEINKTIHDFGVTISWEQKGGNIRNHPLLKMLEKRIHFSETKLGLEPSLDIWETYFIPLPMNFEFIIPDNDSVRLLSQFVEEMDLTCLYDTYSILKENQATPRQMLKILLYAYLDTKYASRVIETACKRQLHVSIRGKARAGSRHNCQTSQSALCSLRKGAPYSVHTITL